MTTQIENESVQGQYVSLDGERYYQIANSHLMPDFFMSLVGASDHWMFVSSNGALTAGRRNADNALFPYAPDDQISAARATTGPTTCIRINNASSETWEPFAFQRVTPKGIRRNLYKTPLGNKLVFEEVNESLDLVFRYRWAFSEKFGFVRSCHLENTGASPCSLEMVDGLLNVLPYGVTSDFTSRFSNLSHAYKKSELIEGSQIGLFYLSSIPTDRAEPSEGLKATTVWQSGLSPRATLLSPSQLPAFLEGQSLETEADVRGQCGAYLVYDAVELAAGESIQWQMAAELEQDHCDVIALDDWLKSNDDPAAAVSDDVRCGQKDLLRIVASADGLQCGSNPSRCNRHLSNTIFNVMRGGIPMDNYQVDVVDFSQHVAHFSRDAFQRIQPLLSELPKKIDAAELQARLAELADPDLIRLGLEYLPLAFSRRHGDPTRPWNRFSIDLRSPDGRTNLNYQGNWRDIFQNWEALAHSFPEFLTPMICRFVNATTADGYNPYRLTKGGFEWEEPTPDDPWANIGYWGDHQIIYLLKLLEWSDRFDPARIKSLLDSPVFVHANVPYRIKDYQQIKDDPQSTIDFDAELSKRISEKVSELGVDGKLLADSQGQIHYVTLIEKLLTLSLAKLSNFVPDGGIWLNTQRPEWNDANNALVGNGVSMVTACYLYRWFNYLRGWVAEVDDETFAVSQEVADLLRKIAKILSDSRDSLGRATEPSNRLQIVEALSQAGSDYRDSLYQRSLSGRTARVSHSELLDFFETSCRHLETTIRNNQRTDGLFHTYNLLRWSENGLEVDHLYEMLEGQVAVLSSGLLGADEVVELLDALRDSALYRENQQSYMLYPDRQLPRFLDKNQIEPQHVESSPLLQQLLRAGDESIVRRDIHGGVHFNGAFRNAADLKAALDRLRSSHPSMVDHDQTHLIRIFEDTFDHREFTGRSGTFFAYEGLGSIYWHMVSKLGLAVSENYFWAVGSGASETTLQSLRSHLDAIRDGIGAEKSPIDYGAFPSDPYSHTPENAGVKQPGMTGQVKEDVLARFAEIGADIESGCLRFRTDLFDRGELLSRPSEFTTYDLQGQERKLQIPAEAFAFTLFQVPVIYQKGEADEINVSFADGTQTTFSGRQLDAATSEQLFARSGAIDRIECQFSVI